MNVFIIGSGNIASHLSKAFYKFGIKISGIHSRNEIEGEKIAKKAKTTFFPQMDEIPKNASIYLLCVSDDAISTVAEQLPKSIKKSKIVAHTSGSVSIASLFNDIKNAGVFYPLQTFTKGKNISYNDIPFCINASNKKSTKALTKLAEKVSNSVHQIDDDQRQSIHLSAVMINNFVNHIIYISEEMLNQKEIDVEILQPLLRETILKQGELGAYDAQTGPSRRKDAKTLEKHLNLLRYNKEYKSIYMILSKSIQKTYKLEK